MFGGRVNALVLAAGPGTRLRPLTDAVPKCLLPIAGRPMLDEWVDRLAAAGVAEARVSSHALREQVGAYADRVRRSGRLAVAESYEPSLLGTAGTVAANADLADGAGHVLIVRADHVSDADLGRMLDFHRGHGDPLTGLMFRPPDANTPLIGPDRGLADGGVYAVTADAYREIASTGATDFGTEILPRFVGRTGGWVWDGYHLNVGTHEALAKARRDAPGRRWKDRPQNPGGRPAVFLDRDGTLIEHVHYLSDPADVRLIPGAADAVRRLRGAGFACVLATNQSAVGRGMFTVERLHEIHAEMDRQLAAEGARLDAIEFCPEAPAVEDRSVVEHPDRKPGPGMLFRAARRLGLDLGASWMVGDLVSDVLAGLNAGCRGNVLLTRGAGPGPADEYQAVPDVSAAADLILAAGLLEGLDS